MSAAEELLKFEREAAEQQAALVAEHNRKIAELREKAEAARLARLEAERLEAERLARQEEERLQAERQEEKRREAERQEEERREAARLARQEEDRRDSENGVEQLLVEDEGASPLADTKMGDDSGDDLGEFHFILLYRHR